MTQLGRRRTTGLDGEKTHREIEVAGLAGERVSHHAWKLATTTTNCDLMSQSHDRASAF
jgi:hypothetical protein